MKRILSSLLVVVMIIGLIPAITIPASAASYKFDEYLAYEVANGEATVSHWIKSPSGEIVIPEEIDGNTVVAIKPGVFAGKSAITSVKLPDTIHTIGQEAFASCLGLKSINIPAALTKIDMLTFTTCRALESIVIGDNVTRIEESAFHGCDKLESVTMGKKVFYIGKNAFYNTPSLKKVYISDLAAWCKITPYNEVAHPMNTADEIYLNGNLLTAVTIPDSITQIGKMAFASSKITSIMVPNTVTEISNGAFRGATNLKELTIPFVGKTADDTQYNFLAYPFGGLQSGLAPQFVPATLEKVTVTNAKTLGGNAFYGLSGLKSVSLNNGITSIGNMAFYNCSALTSITIPGTANTLGQNIFYNCTALKDVVFSDGCTTVAPAMFYYCTGLENVTFPATLTKVEDMAFCVCNALKNVYYCGTSRQKADIELGDAKEWLLGATGYSNAKWQYHKYTNACDKDCDICKTTRTVSHNYAAATCTKAKTCKDCKVTSGKALGHSYAAATCKAPKTCSRCKATTGSKGSHSYAAATCTKPKTCKVCKATSGKALGHSYAAATCKAPKTCKVCKATSGSKAAHTYKKTVAKATLTKNGKITNTCSVCKATTTTTLKAVKTVKLSATTYTYNGSAKTPTVTVKDSAGKTLKKNTDYTVTYASGRKSAGKYKVTVTMKGNYSGTKTLYFTIKPKASAVSTLTAKSKALAVKFTKQTSGTGYEIQYSTSKSFKSPKTVKVTKNSTTTATLKSLKAKTTYYVRIRTYKTVGSTKYYSAWSAAKSKKTK